MAVSMENGIERSCDWKEQKKKKHIDKDERKRGGLKKYL